jgi:hypothetical protein
MQGRGETVRLTLGLVEEEGKQRETLTLKKKRRP